MPCMPCALQCEQTKGNVGCDKVGVCGKTPQVAILQDLLIYQLKVRVSTAVTVSTATTVTPAVVYYVLPCDRPSYPAMISQPQTCSMSVCTE
jgi:hydroxylamine reductase (hybrid-cluster protein)